MSDNDNTADESATEQNERDASTAEAVGESIGRLPGAAIGAVGRGAEGFLRGLTAHLPFYDGGHKVWLNIGTKAFRNAYKVGGADAVNLVARPNHNVEPVLVKWDKSTDNDPTSKWISKDGQEEWHPATLGQGVDMLGGKVPVILSQDDADEVFSPLRARLAEVCDMDQVQDLVAYDEIQHIEVQQHVDPDALGGSSGAAVADGGVEESYEEWALPPSERARLEDVLIDPYAPDGADGLRISWRKTDGLLAETTTSDEMKRQEERGRIAESHDDETLALIKKIVIYAFLAIAAVAVGPSIVKVLLGSGGGSGGGGGGLLPLAMGVVG